MPPFLPLVEDFLAGLGAARRSQHTLDGYRNDLLGVGRRIAGQLRGPDASVDQLDAAELDQRVMRLGFAAWAADHSEGSLLRAWGVWDRFFAFLVNDEVLVRNPMRSVPKPKLPQTAPRSIRHENPAETLLMTVSTPDSAAKTSKRWPERDVALVATFCVTGIRLSEAIGLNLNSILGSPGARRLQVTGKGNKDRAIPIEPALEALIDRYLESRTGRHGGESLENPRSPLFVHYDGTRLTRGRIQYLVERVYERAGLRSAVPKGALVHALRHTFASQAVEYGTDVVELRDILGHASLATTSRYLDANAQRLREAVAAHPAQRALRQVG
jgi:site-specific recombinase XerD